MIADYAGVDPGGGRDRIPGIMTSGETKSFDTKNVHPILRPFDNSYFDEKGFIIRSKRPNATQRDIDFLNWHKTKVGSPTGQISKFRSYK